MKVAAVNWKIRNLAGEEGFFQHLHDLLAQGAEAGADLIVLPELAILELLSLKPEVRDVEVPAWLARFAPAYEASLIQGAKQHRATIVGGSHFRHEGGGIVNAAAIATPDGAIRFQPKVKLTTYEREVWKIQAGHRLTSLADHRTAVTVCYDSEFPESGRLLAERGALVQCVPAFTETIRGFQRVRWCCHARAVENQIFVVHASLVGDLGREPVPSTYGTSAILCPSIEPFPENAILAETPSNEEAIAIAHLDFEALEQARREGDVRNWDDRQPDW